ncbi:hypothetical protein LguiA_006123 [Lonicera macranthoides]
MVVEFDLCKFVQKWICVFWVLGFFPPWIKQLKKATQVRSKISTFKHTIILLFLFLVLSLSFLLHFKLFAERRGWSLDLNHILKE